MGPSRVLAVFVGLILCMGGCVSSSHLYLRSELANDGPVALSTDNPYLAANLFVAQEMEHSDVFRGFIQYRGTPDAIEVRKSTLKPLRVFLFYLDDLEAYSLVEKGQGWLIRGPEKIPSKMMTAFFNMPNSGRPPPLAIDGYEDAPEPKGNTAHKHLEEPPLVSPQPYSPEPSTKKKKSVRRPVTEKPAKTNQQAPAEEDLVKSHATASESTSGDLLHRVTFEGESLRLISAWYTGDAKNSNRIARINGIDSPDSLNIGQSIRIPRYLLKTTKPLPQSALEAEK